MKSRTTQRRISGRRRRAAPGQNEGLKRNKTLVSFREFTTETFRVPTLQSGLIIVLKIINIIIIITITVMSPDGWASNKSTSV